MYTLVLVIAVWANGIALTSPTLPGFPSKAACVAEGRKATTELQTIAAALKSQGGLGRPVSAVSYSCVTTMSH